MREKSFLFGLIFIALSIDCLAYSSQKVFRDSIYGKCSLNFDCHTLNYDCHPLEKQNNINSFLHNLSEIVRRKDAKSLILRLSPKIKSIEDVSGVNAFVEYWGIGLDSQKNSKIWILLKQLLEIDGVITDSASAVIPFTILLNSGRCNGKGSLFFARREIGLFEKPERNSKVILKLNRFSLVQMTNSPFNKKQIAQLKEDEFLELTDSWVEVSVRNKIGYVNSNAIWGNLAIFFELVDGKWLINSIQNFD